MAFYTYIAACGRNGTLYTGSTDDLVNRVRQHKEKTFAGFTAKHDVNQLVWFQIFGRGKMLSRRSAASRSGTGSGSFR
jgi:putative endonuclease